MKTLLAIGESMARFSSQEGKRLLNAADLQLHYGGAEANVAMNLARLDHTVKFATKLPENSGLADNCLMQLRGSNVNCDNVIFGPGRLGSYFLEVGVGLRPTNIIYDRKYSTISLMEELEWDLDELFEDIDVLHITGITLALSKSWHRLGVELIKEAKERGIEISFDMNYRQTMWSYEEAIPVYQEILPLVDYLSASDRDATAFMGIEEVENPEPHYYFKEMTKKYPSIKYIYGTKRHQYTPNSYQMVGFVYGSKEDVFYVSKKYDMYQIVDRVGSGDSYATGILDGILRDADMQEAVEFAMANSALKHTVYGDVNPFSRKEIESFMVNKDNVLR
ncbi:sugar kinase [Aerococcaceae bacterium DSM 111022]|nr:sugar kinase [Aerococcaceae bacterium DSM 111022]